MNNVEIILSDRHGEDHCLATLEAYFKDNARIIIKRAIDGIGWVEHYNLLLLVGTGKYFMWMPHDDEFPEGYVSELARILDQDDDLILAFGGIKGIDTDQNLIRGREYFFPWPNIENSELLPKKGVNW